jgi:hypothetical protein
MEPTLLKQYDEATAKLDDSICEICLLCGDLRMRSGEQHNGDTDDEMEGLSHSNAQLLRQELRYLRQNYQGLKLAVDRVLDDHETRIRALHAKIGELENQKYLVIGGGAVLGWLGSVLMRLFIK